MFDFAYAYSGDAGIGGYLLVIDWRGLGQLVTEDLVAFLAWWMPLNVVVTTVVVVSIVASEYGRWSKRLQLASFHRGKGCSPTPPEVDAYGTCIPLRSFLTLALCAAPVFVLATLAAVYDAWKRHRWIKRRKAEGKNWHWTQDI